MKHSRTRRGAAAFGLLLALGVAIGTAQGAGEQIRRAATASGGGIVSAGQIRLITSVGQPVAGAVQGQLTLCSGLICGAGAPSVGPAPEDTLYLPLLAR